MPNLISRCRFRVNRACAALLQRVLTWLDRNADKQGGGWGATMEYRHRYTNPDAAKKARGADEPERRQRERRS